MTEWGTDASVEQETVRAVVLAYAAGKVTLPAVPGKVPKSQIRYAPPFRRGGCSRIVREHPYTAETVVEAYAAG
jgi:hypothetical protein